MGAVRGRDVVVLHRPHLSADEKVVPLYCYVAARRRFLRGADCLERVPYLLHRVGKRCFRRRPKKLLSEDACLKLSAKNPDLWDDRRRSYGIWWRDTISSHHGQVKTPGFSLRDKVETFLYWPRAAAGTVDCGVALSEKALPTTLWKRLQGALTGPRAGGGNKPVHGSRLKLGNWTRVDVDKDGKAELIAVVQVLPRAGANTDEVVVRYNATSVLLLLRGGSPAPPQRLAERSGVAGIEGLFDLNGDGLPELLLHGCAGRSECSYSIVVPRKGATVWEEI